MQDYKAMYLDLFNKITDAIRILQEAQQEAENAYIENGGESISPERDNDEKIKSDNE